MAKFEIVGQKPLKGEVLISGAKNAALKILPAAILASSPSEISNVPDILDIRKMIEILESIGARVEFKDNVVKIDPTNVSSFRPDEKLVKQLRGSIVLAGALLAKFNRATFTEPGGCLIGSRAIDDHLDVFSQYGIKTSLRNGRYEMHGKPKATNITLKNMSVTATENAILTSVFSEGTTAINVAACEPEIGDLIEFLNKMGARIEGKDSHTIKITGVKTLSGAKHTILPDRIEAGTFIMTGVATNSEITVGPLVFSHLSLVLKRLEDAGATFEYITKNGKEYIKTKRWKKLEPQNINTRTFPGFPTDLQSPYTIVASQMSGQTKIFETMFEGRFAFVEELKLLRVKINILNPYEIIVFGPASLKASEIACNDLRGGAALVMAALLAEGKTIISQVESIDRGYDRIDQKLRQIGASITRIEG